MQLTCTYAIYTLRFERSVVRTLPTVSLSTNIVINIRQNLQSEYCGMILYVIQTGGLSSYIITNCPTISVVNNIRENI